MDDLRDIIEKAKKGDRDAFSFLYKAYYRPIFRYCRIRVSKREDAEDIAQDVFLKGYGAFGTFNLRGMSALPFFYTIAKNSVIDFYRKKRIPLVHDENADVIDLETPETVAFRVEDREFVYVLLEKLTDNERDSIVMKFIDNMTTKEIAHMIGRSEESVRQLQSRGLRKLKSLYEKQI